MIVVTGAAGFIGSCLVSKLNQAGYERIMVVDDFSKTEKEHNLVGKTIGAKINRIEFLNWFKENGKDVDFVYHIGARTDTAEFDKAILIHQNLKHIFQHRLYHRFLLQLIHASTTVIKQYR